MLIMPGSNRFPVEGDVIQVHYSSYLVEKAKLIESSRSLRGRPFEFVLGTGQVPQEPFSLSHLSGPILTLSCHSLYRSSLDGTVV